MAVHQMIETQQSLPRFFSSRQPHRNQSWRC